MVCAKGLRVWRSCRNLVNQSGNGSALKRVVVGAGPGQRRAGWGPLGTPLRYRQKMDDQSYPLDRKALPDSVVAAATTLGEETGQSDELAGGPECDFQLPTRCDWIIERRAGWVTASWEP